MCEEFGISLRRLSAKLLVCMDHGRFRPDDNHRAAQALKRTFIEGLIDVYLCSVSELRQYIGLFGVVADGATTEAEATEQWAKSHVLPRITVVRSDRRSTDATAFVLIEGSFSIVTVKHRAAPSGNHPGPTNAFNMNQAGKYPDLQKVAPGATWRASYWVKPEGF